MQCRVREWLMTISRVQSGINYLLPISWWQQFMQLNQDTLDPSTLAYPSTSIRDLLLLYAAVDDRPFQLTSIILQDSIRVVNLELHRLSEGQVSPDKSDTKGIRKKAQLMRVESSSQFSKIVIGPQILWESGMEWVAIGKRLWRLISSVSDMEIDNAIIALMTILGEKEANEINFQSVPSYKPISSTYNTLQYSYLSVFQSYLALVDLPSNLNLSVILPLIKEELNQITGAISIQNSRDTRMWVIGSKVMNQQQYQKEISQIQGFSNVLQIQLPSQIQPKRKGSNETELKAGMYGRKMIKLNQNLNQRKNQRQNQGNISASLPDLMFIPRLSNFDTFDNNENYQQLQRQAPTPPLSFSTNMETPPNFRVPVIINPSVRIDHPLWIQRPLNIQQMRSLCRKSMKEPIRINSVNNGMNTHRHVIKARDRQIYLQIRRQDIQEEINRQSSSDEDQSFKDKPVPAQMRLALNRLASSLLILSNLQLPPPSSPSMEYQIDEIDEKKQIEEQKTEKREGIDSESSRDEGGQEDS